MTPRVALLGIPNDENSSYMRGPADAPDFIRRELFCDAYTITAETGAYLGDPGCLNDLGDLAFGTASDPWAVIEQGVARAIEGDQPVICLGGDHAITHPIMRAIRARHRRISILHIDAHPDIYHDYQGNPRSHTSPFARLLEEGLADRVVQVGLRTVNAHHREQFARFGVEAIEAFRCEVMPKIVFDTPVYLSIDMDALDPSCAPGVSHREPGGLTTRQVITLIQSIEQPLIGADVVEFNPRNDIANMTATVAAKLVKEIAGVMIRNGPPRAA